MLNIYEFVTPSDPITFKAPNDKVACICSLILGQGKAGCINVNARETKIPSILIFEKEPQEIIENFLGQSIEDFKKENSVEIVECFKSFAYGSVSDRKNFENACDAITCPKKLKKFKEKHDDVNRTSLSAWVKAAWELAEVFKKYIIN